MFTRLCQATVPAALLLCASCSSTPETSSQVAVDPVLNGSESVSREGDAGMARASDTAGAPAAREVPDFFALKPWTGAFQETAVMVANTVRIEGPQGLLDHVAAASDDEYYERTAEVTAEGFRQTIVRLGPDAPEIRVRIDRWTVAATQRVVILENINACEVTVVAGGDALWRDVDGHIAQADRLEFVGVIGQNVPVRPANVQDANVAQDPATSDSATDQGNAANESSPNESSPNASVPNASVPQEGDSPGSEVGSTGESAIEASAAEEPAGAASTDA